LTKCIGECSVGFINDWAGSTGGKSLQAPQRGTMLKSTQTLA
jgi:hypothetical protein